MFYTYAIRSLKVNRIYIGLTENIERRVKEHNNGLTKSTQFYRPWELFYSEKFEDRLSARKKEKYLKSGCGREFLKSLLCP
jgi:putative endonuclease